MLHLAKRRFSFQHHIDHGESDHAERNAYRATNPARSMPSVWIMFMYWGRRGLSRFLRDLADVTIAGAHGETTVSLSRQNEGVGSFKHLGSRLFLVDTFTADHGAITQAWRVPLLRRDLVLGHHALRREQRSMSRFLAECVRVAAASIGSRQCAASS